MRTLAIPALLLLVACGDGGDSDTDAAATFTQVRDDVLVPTCGTAGCHDATTAESGLVFDANLAPADLVGVESTDAPGEILVVAGDPDASYLVKKVEGQDDIVGDPMPPPFGGLDAEQIEMIRSWIAAGAN